MSDSLWPHGLQHTRLFCPSPTPGACSNSCPSSRWCHPTISSSVIPFSSRLHSFPASGSFPMSQFFESGGQGTGASASASVLPMNIQGWFYLGLTCLISLLSKELSRVPLRWSGGWGLQANLYHSQWKTPTELHSFVPLRSLITETCSRTNIVAKLRAQNG